MNLRRTWGKQTLKNPTGKRPELPRGIAERVIIFYDEGKETQKRKNDVRLIFASFFHNSPNFSKIQPKTGDFQVEKPFEVIAGFFASEAESFIF